MRGMNDDYMELAHGRIGHATHLIALQFASYKYQIFTNKFICHTFATTCRLKSFNTIEEDDQ